jgi:hypothetical protein
MNNHFCTDLKMLAAINNGIFHSICFRCEKGKNLRMQSVRIASSWQIGSNIQNGRRIKEKFSAPGLLLSIFKLKIVLYVSFLKFKLENAKSRILEPDIDFFLTYRSVYERALDCEHRNIPLWLKYTEMEMRNKQVNDVIYERNSKS